MPYVAIALCSYLAGSIPFGYLVGRLRGVDLRSSGSGNIGATNALRSLGGPAALLTLVGDAGKTLVAVLAIGALPGVDRAWSKPIAAAACALGHVFPVWLRFKGGKGVAVGATAAFALAPLAALPSLGVFAIAVAVTRFVSLGSILAALALPASYAIVHRGSGFSPAIFAFFTGAAALVLVAHRGNIARILNGTERRLGDR